MKDRKHIRLRVRVSDMEHMGAVFYIGKVVEESFLVKKYESKLFFENTTYYIYVRYGFYSGARISGVAVPLYTNKEYALLACKRLNESYQDALRNNRNNIRAKQRKCLWGELAVHAIFILVLVMYLQRAFVVLDQGLTVHSFILSILYSIIIGLCYIIHYHLQ